MANTVYLLSPGTSENPIDVGKSGTKIFFNNNTKFEITSITLPKGLAGNTGRHMPLAIGDTAGPYTISAGTPPGTYDFLFEDSSPAPLEPRSGTIKVN